ncbi:MAG: threonine ammonia-lyase [Acidobacteriota bacterium]|nr:MAG: threonine ammonia-lyase [Acidobacteriota bacterium]
MAVTLEDILKARETLTGVINHTPVLPDRKLTKDLGANIYLKAECLQRGGSFKIRGAYNKIVSLSDEEKQRGVVTASAGNHAQGVALAASLHHIRSTIVLPEYAPLTKVNATKNFGGDVILHGASFDEASAYARELRDEHGYTYVHAFDDEKIIAGQGTIGVEIAEALPEVDIVVVPIGGGGVIAGIAIAIKALRPDARVIGVEAENIAVIAKSLEAGEPIEVPFNATIADGIAIKKPGGIPLEIIRDTVDEIVEVTEEEIAEGIFHCVQDGHLVVEGAGAAGVAAILAGKAKVKEGQTACAVLCGGNIDANLLARILEHVLVKQGRYMILRVLIVDRPGYLASLLDKVAHKGGNVIEVFHRRSMWFAPLGMVGVELLLEVRDEDHGQELIGYLSEAGYKVERETAGEWPSHG